MITAVQRGSSLSLSLWTLCLLIPGIPQWWPKLLRDNKGVWGIPKGKARFKQNSDHQRMVYPCMQSRRGQCPVPGHRWKTGVFCFVVNRYRRRASPCFWNEYCSSYFRRHQQARVTTLLQQRYPKLSELSKLLSRGLLTFFFHLLMVYLLRKCKGSSFLPP